MEVLFATTNPAKIKTYKEKLENHGIKVLTLKDIGIDVSFSDSLDIIKEKIIRWESK